MSWFYRNLVRPALFRHDAEEIHDQAMQAVAWAGRLPAVTDAIASFFAAPALPVHLFGLTFPNPLGIAAGLDKSAAGLPVWEALGFGFAELGGVTWHPQPGNPKPRLFRAPGDQALINRMGFNNPGAEAVAEKLRAWRAEGLWPRHPVGMNLGKSRVTPLEEAPLDYARSFQVLWPWIDFFVINVSSPNTPGLTGLQAKQPLAEILAAIQEANRSEAGRSEKGRRPKPVLVKVSPDLSFDGLDSLLELAEEGQFAGFVATNTTTERPAGSGLETGPAGSRPLVGKRESIVSFPAVYSEAGGLSGRPLRCRSTEVIRHLYQESGGRVPIVGVGGISSGADAWEKIQAGASLLQVYTGLIYEGPTLAQEIVRYLDEQIALLGLRDLSEAVGSGGLEENIGQHRVVEW